MDLQLKLELRDVARKQEWKSTKQLAMLQELDRRGLRMYLKEMSNE